MLCKNPYARENYDPGARFSAGKSKDLFRETAQVTGKFILQTADPFVSRFDFRN